MCRSRSRRWWRSRSGPPPSRPEEPRRPRQAEASEEAWESSHRNGYSFRQRWDMGAVPVSGPGEMRLALGEKGFDPDPVILGLDRGEALLQLFLGERPRVEQPAHEFLVPARHERRALGDAL